MALTDKYRPETCCIIANYYSLRGQHEKAVEYFRRALKLNRNYLSAWTLMGHEYVEMQNPHAAIGRVGTSAGQAASTCNFTTIADIIHCICDHLFVLHRKKILFLLQSMSSKRNAMH